MVNSASPLIDQIRALVDEPVAGDRGPYLAKLEHTLTDACAAALALEAERLRLTKRIGEVAAQLGTGDSANKTEEISQLATRLSDADGDLTRLRALLRTLRTRASAVRSAA
jgi:hypothetical protein